MLERDPYWIPEAPLLSFSPPNSNFNGQGFAVFADTTWVRMTPSFDDNISDRVEPPIVISQQLADRFAVAVGGRVSFSLEETYVNGSRGRRSFRQFPGPSSRPRSCSTSAWSSTASCG